MKVKRVAGLSYGHYFLNSVRDSRSCADEKFGQDLIPNTDVPDDWFGTVECYWSSLTAVKKP